MAKKPVSAPRKRGRPKKPASPIAHMADGGMAGDVIDKRVMEPRILGCRRSLALVAEAEAGKVNKLAVLGRSTPLEIVS